MTTTVELPLWLVVLALVLAAIAALERVLMPSARWFLRRRMERLLGRLNTHLARPIHPFRLMARQDRIVQLTYDPKVLQAAGVNPDEWQGFAFGMGIDRIAMLKYGIPDLRAFFESDLRWLRHYGFSALDVPDLAGGLSR